MGHSHEIEDYFKQYLCRFFAKTCKRQFSQRKTHIFGGHLPRLIALFVTLLVQNSLREPLLSSYRRLCGYCRKAFDWRICSRNAKVRPRCIRLCSFSLRVCPSSSNICNFVTLECPKCRNSRKHTKHQFYRHQTTTYPLRL